MSASEFKVEQIDHVHVYVADRREAAEWYRRVLGLVVLKEDETFDEDDDGPVTVSSDGGSTSLALFRAPEGAGRFARRQTVAFRVGGAGFLEFLHRLESLEVAGADGRRLGAGDVVDHDYCFSVYFKDPDGNPYELTTYDYDLVRRWLGASTGG